MNNDTQICLELSQAYRILAALALDDHTYTHLSARAEDGESFFIYPFGLRFAEVTPECLMKVRFDGTVLQGDEYQYNKTGYVIHGQVYQARPDIHAVFHLHTPATAAVSAMKEGLLPISQWALHFYERIGYHDYDSLALDSEQGQALTRDLQDFYTLLLRHHGSLTCGRTIQEAMFYTYHLEQACQTQIMALSTNREILIPSPEICRKAVHDLLSFEEDLGQRDWQAFIRSLDPRDTQDIGRTGRAKRYAGG